MSINEMPRLNLLHIGIFGKRNSGKSTLINALTGHRTARVSAVAGTTKSPVYQNIEIDGIGPCVLIDTAGFDDIGYMGQMKVEKTKQALERTEVALIVCSEEDIAQELEWAKEFKAHNAPVIMVINKIDQISNTDKIRKKIYEALKQEPIKISAISKMGIEKIREEIIRNIPEDFEVRGVIRDQVYEGDTVLLVLPENIEAPKGRLNLPQIQILRELLDKKCMVLNITADKLEEALAAYAKPPKIIIADVQVLPQVSEKKPAESVLTSLAFQHSIQSGE